MRLPHLLMALSGMFNSNAKLYESQPKRTRTSRNTHKRNRFEVSKGFFIDAINIESARAQYDKIMRHKAMRLQKSFNKQLQYAA